MSEQTHHQTSPAETPADPVEGRKRSFFDKLRSRKLATGLAAMALAGIGAGGARSASLHESSRAIATQNKGSFYPKNPSVYTLQFLERMNKNPQILNCVIFLPPEKYGNNYDYFKMFPFDNSPVYNDQLGYLDKKFGHSIPEITYPRYTVDKNGHGWILVNDARVLIPNSPDDYGMFTPYAFPAVEGFGGRRWVRTDHLPKGAEVVQEIGAPEGGKPILKGRLVRKVENPQQRIAFDGNYIEVDGISDTDIGMLDHVTPMVYSSIVSQSKKFPSLDKFLHP